MVPKLPAVIHCTFLTTLNCEWNLLELKIERNDNFVIDYKDIIIFFLSEAYLFTAYNCIVLNFAHILFGRRVFFFGLTVSMSVLQESSLLYSSIVSILYLLSV